MLMQQTRLEQAMRFIAALLAVAFLPDAGAQKWAAEQQTAPKSAPQQKKAPFAAAPSHDPQRERCANFRRELRLVRQQERETTNTGARDHAGLRRQQLLQQMQQAGCK
jgi:hypothetical protein